MSKLSELAGFGKLLCEKGLCIGAGGNISAAEGDEIIIKKQGARMEKGDPKDYIRVRLDKAGEHKEKMSTEAPFHIACYNARPDIRAVVHAHPPMSVAAANKAQVIEADISYEFKCIMQKPVPVIDYVQPGSEDLARAIAEKIRGGANAVLMKRHGAVSVGTTIEEAYLRMLALDRACVTLLHS